MKIFIMVCLLRYPWFARYVIVLYSDLQPWKKCSKDMAVFLLSLCPFPWNGGINYACCQVRWLPKQWHHGCTGWRNKKHCETIIEIGAKWQHISGHRRLVARRQWRLRHQQLLSQSRFIAPLSNMYALSDIRLSFLCFSAWVCLSLHVQISNSNSCSLSYLERAVKCLCDVLNGTLRFLSNQKQQGGPASKDRSYNAILWIWRQ
jgi:hypothetical protein